MSIRTNILLRVYIAFGLIFVLAGAVVIQLYRIQFIQGKKWRSMADSHTTRYQTIQATRGNIYSADGSLLATSVPEYELHMDMLAGGISEERVFNEKVDSLALCLSQYFKDRSPREYARMLREARNDSSRYQLIRRKVSYEDLQAIRKFPIFNLGRNRGGLIAIEQNKRVLPYEDLAARTIGYKNENVKNAVGLEGAYAGYIDGEDGKRLVQRLPGNIWIPVNNGQEDISPKDGADIISTIDVNFQDIAEKALVEQLKKTKADHGCVVLMEVATGEIKAIANFGRVTDSVYKEKYNYAISEAADPGSTFKLATYMTLFDQHKIDTNTMVDGGGGKYKVPKGPTISDVEENGMLTAKQAFEQSSNVAAAKFVVDHYSDNPWQFTDKLYSYHLNERLGLQIPGEATPVVRNPGNKWWNKNYSLPEMAYGYEMRITPLQMLAFYNSVPNGGKMISPMLVKEIRRLGNTVEQFQARTINDKVCSDATLGKMRALLEGVVKEGTAKTLFKGCLFPVAGKTGTAQIAQGKGGYGDNGERKYQASFCGYFPANHPKYSMIVVINKPSAGEYLAALVAGPVFRQIAEHVYASDLEVSQAAPIHYVGNTKMPQVKTGNVKALKEVYSKLNIKPLYASASVAAPDTSEGVPFEETGFKPGIVPSVKGMDLTDALYMLGNAGYKVTVRGSGAVVNQSIAAGSTEPKGARIQIDLQ